MTIPQLADEAAFNDFIANNATAIVHFYTSWAPSCDQLNVLLTDLLVDFNTVRAAYLEAETVSTVTFKFNVTAAPTLIFFKDGKKVAQVDGYKPSDIRLKLTELTMLGSSSAAVSASSSAPKEDLNTRLKNLINRERVMLFMKGAPEQPRCGFSRQIVELLKEKDIKYGSFDILSDEDVRQGLKTYSNWPTYPQVYLDGELLGGLDVIREEIADASFVASLPKNSENTAKSSAGKTLNDRLESLIKSHKLMLFMKGNPSQPRCGFSRQVIDLLNSQNAEYGTFDILEDEQVRQGLKEYSKWPTFPQIYLDGELLGGLDVFREELSDADFVSKLPKKA